MKADLGPLRIFTAKRCNLKAWTVFPRETARVARAPITQGLITPGLITRGLITQDLITQDLITRVWRTSGLTILATSARECR